MLLGNLPFTLVKRIKVLDKVWGLPPSELTSHKNSLSIR